jgi:protoporphyrinogen oxidase
MASVGILGGGPAGLGLAYNLSQLGHAVTLFEAADALGGLARSFQLGDATIERYYHFICADDTEYFSYLRRLGIESSLRWSNTRMGFHYDNKLYPFSSPLDLLRCGALTPIGRLRYAALAARCSLTSNWRALDQVPARDWLIDALGLEAYRVTWQPLLEVKFHEFHDKISAAWIWHRIHRVARSRGGPFEKERLGYLEGGTDTLVNALVAASRSAGAKLLTSTPIKKIVHDGYRCTGVETAAGVTHAFDHVVSAVPLPHFTRMLSDGPEDYRTQLSAIDFIGVLCVTLRLRHSVSNNYWLNVNDPRIPFNGCIEYTNLNPKMTPDGSHILYVPFYLPRSHPRFKYSDEKNIADAVAALTFINPELSADWVIDAAVSRDPYAQVICSTGFALRVPPHQTPLHRLYLIESSQLYPSDRTISGTLELASRVARMIGRA